MAAHVFNYAPLEHGLIMLCDTVHTRSLKALLGHGLLRDCRSVTAVYECTLQPGMRSGNVVIYRFK